MNLKEGSVDEAIQVMEREMKAMWDTDEVLHILKEDAAFITTIMLSLHYERQYFADEIGVIIGEA
tara:strand:- start:73 stop:267 length:195 start_codon:yes stop_codon:yes gene_type:complete